jgi:hypothetical protein
MNKLTSKQSYFLYSSIFNWSTSSISVISTNSMLTSIVGSSPSNTALITTSYISKDIIGQAGGLVYSWKTGKKADKDPMNYILKGVFLQHLSFYMENCSGLIQSTNYIIPFLGLCSILKNVSFISIGAVNARNIQKLSKDQNNIGELYSQIASINTLSSTAGMITGLGIVRFIPDYTVRTIVVMPLLTGISLYTAKKMTEN